MNIIKRVALAVNQGFCLVLTGQNDLTLSAWSYCKKVEENKPIYSKVVNKIFFWQEDHCAGATRWEYRAAQKQLKRLEFAYRKANE